MFGVGEEHQVAGGLGSAIAELLIQGTPYPQEFIAVKDSFGESGTPAQLMEKYGLTANDIVTAAKRAIARKSKKKSGVRTKKSLLTPDCTPGTVLTPER